MAEVREEQNLDNRNNDGQGAGLLDAPINPVHILADEVARLVQTGEPCKYNQLKLMALLRLADALAGTHGDGLKVRATVRDVVSTLARRSGEAQELTHEVERLQGTLDGIVERHEAELAELRKELEESRRTLNRQAADHQVDLGRVRSKFEAEAVKLTTRIDELLKSDSGKLVGRLLADREALQERLQRALNELSDVRKGLNKGPRKVSGPTTEPEVTTECPGTETDKAETEGELRKKVKALGASHSKERHLRQEAETTAALAKANFERTDALLKLTQQELVSLRKKVLESVSDCGHAAELKGLRDQVIDLTKHIQTISASIIIPQKAPLSDGGSDGLKDEIARLTKELAEAQADAKRKTEQFNELRKNFPSRTDPRDVKLKEERDRLRRDTTNLEKDLERAGRLIETLNTRLVALSDEDSKLDERIDLLRGQRDEAVAKSAEMEVRITELENQLALACDEYNSGNIERAIADIEQQLVTDAIAIGRRLDELDQRIRELAHRKGHGTRAAEAIPAAARTAEQDLEQVPRPAFLKANGAALFDRLFRKWGVTLWSILMRTEKPCNEFVTGLLHDNLITKKDAETAKDFHAAIRALDIWNEDGSLSQEKTARRIQTIKETFR